LLQISALLGIRIFLNILIALLTAGLRGQLPLREEAYVAVFEEQLLAERALKCFPGEKLLELRAVLVRACNRSLLPVLCEEFLGGHRIVQFVQQESSLFCTRDLIDVFQVKYIVYGHVSHVEDRLNLTCRFTVVFIFVYVHV
jgi:hypothetical protein